MLRKISFTLFLVVLALAPAKVFGQTNRAISQADNKAAGTSSPVVTDEKSRSEASPLTDLYRVGVGDVIDIRLLNSNNNKSTLFTVLDGGLIEFPLTGGAINVAGRTTQEIQTLLARELKRRAIHD